jgi:uncharacterized protein YyaL (SSP411 family)
MAHDAAPFTNRLASETSPYLLQHAHNPVDWYPWGPEALARARAEDRPIFLSIGYSACHWCHVMERESFEDPHIASQLNASFVPIKVDREERPDLDQIYMSAVQAMTGHGGWPMSVFLTPDLEPFFGGTYYPPRDARGMPGFERVLDSVARAWRERRPEILETAGAMTEQLRAAGKVPRAEGDLTTVLLDNAARALARAFEPTHGGFGRAPKFPHAMDLKVLLRQYARTGDTHALHMVRHTLDKMARGGIYDHLGGGFARYSTDDRWLVPHFEKMLYDNALLASVYLEAFQVTRGPDYARVARETFDYLLREMTGPDGGFAATEDADSEGVEGKFYVWTLAEIREVLGADRAQTLAYVYDVTEAGNWEGHTILHLPKPLAQAAKLLGRPEDVLRAELDADRAKLLAVRERRVPPAKDTKVLTSWNGLLIAALADGARILADERYLVAAQTTAAFLLEHMRNSDGRLLHAYKDGRARFNAYLDDYACLIDGLIRLFEADGEPRWLSTACDLARVMVAEFHDPEQGGFFYTGAAHEALIARQRDTYDNATPSGNAMAATALVRLGALTSDDHWTVLGRQALEAAHVILAQAPTAAGQSLVALDFILSPGQQFAVIAGSDGLQHALEAIAADFRPNKVVAPALDQTGGPQRPEIPLLADRTARNGRTTTYICRDYVCQAPVVGQDELLAALAGDSCRAGRPADTLNA